MGFEISESGFKPAEKFNSKVDGLTAPKNRKGLQRLLGIINFYRAHIPSLAERLAPIYEILSPKVAFKWTSKQQKALDTLKHIIKLGSN